MWGFSSSPLVVHDRVIVYAGGPKGKSMLAYKADSGKLAWAAGDDLGHSYCSPHLTTLDGVEQVLVSTESGLTAFHPTRGDVLWQHNWPLSKDMARVVQPAILDKTDVLLGTPFGGGTKRLRITHKGTSWSEEEAWTTLAIKPYFNDLVVHKGCLYGFDGVFFTCVSLEDGKQRCGHPGLRQRAGSLACRAESASRSLREGRGGAAGGEPRAAPGAGPIPGDQGQDVEPPRGGARQAVRAQR